MTPSYASIIDYLKPFTRGTAMLLGTKVSSSEPSAYVYPVPHDDVSSIFWAIICSILCSSLIGLGICRVTGKSNHL